MSHPGAGGRSERNRDGASLVDWIAQRIDDLSPESRNCPGICEVPTVFET